MPLPKKKNDNNIYPTKWGNARVDELLRQSDENTTFLPQSITIADIDGEIINLITNGDLSIVIEDETVPAIFMTNERWGEFAKTWMLTNDDKNVNPPFITIKRASVQNGTAFGEKFNIGEKTFQYLKVPTYEDQAHGFDIYKIPQPTAVDITYEVRLFTRYILDVNTFVEHYLYKYNGRQHYITVNGHFMQTVKEDFGDESTVEDINGDRYYVAVANITARGYLQDESKFEKVVPKNRIMVITEFVGTGLANSEVIKKS